MLKKILFMTLLTLITILSGCQTAPEQQPEKRRPSNIPESLHEFLRNTDEDALIGICFSQNANKRKNDALDEIARQLSTDYEGTAVNFYSHNTAQSYVFRISFAISLSSSTLSSWLKENNIPIFDEYHFGEWYAVAIKFPVDIMQNYPKAIMPVMTLFTIEEAVKRAAIDVSNRLPDGSKIAIVNISAADPDDAEFVIEELSTELVKRSEKYTIVDRRTLGLAAIRAEQDFQISGDVCDDTIVSIGKLLGADVVITGSITGANEFRRLRVKALDVETARLLIQTNLKY